MTVLLLILAGWFVSGVVVCAGWSVYRGRVKARVRREAAGE